MIKKFLKRFLLALDDETVLTFQAMYYVLFTAFAAMLVFLPSIPVQEAETALNPWVYDAWLLTNLFCPSMTLVGRRLVLNASRAQPGKSNSAVGAAWLQLTGDLGVWGSVNLWVGFMFQTAWWTYNLFVVFFMGMGVLGGFMFTARSIRRLMQISHIERHLP